jgi:hypothetical protein
MELFELGALSIPGWANELGFAPTIITDLNNWDKFVYFGIW